MSRITVTDQHHAAAQRAQLRPVKPGSKWRTVTIDGRHLGEVSDAALVPALIAVKRAA